jgi:hypothetical protein
MGRLMAPLRPGTVSSTSIFASGRIGIRTYLMGPMHQLFCGGPFDARQLNHHSHGNTKSFSLSQKTKGNRRVKCYISGIRMWRFPATTLRAPMKQAT